VPGDTNLVGVDRYEWERLLRRVRVSASAKHVGHACASYANADGTSIYPGTAKLAAVTGYTEKTVRVALKALRDVGLVQRVREGRRAGRAALADEYRLTRPLDLIDRVHLLDVYESAESVACDGRCHHKGSPVVVTGDPVGPPVMVTGDPDSDTPTTRRAAASDHRYSVPGTPVMSSGTPVTDAPNTGNGYPPPTHDHPCDQLKNQRDDHVRDVTTRGDGDMLAALQEFDRVAAARKAAR
jgi:DNA-binding transcriptional ArsR family regulator